MKEKNLMEQNCSFLKCENCIFNDGCENMFTECPANFISSSIGFDDEDFDFMHFKNCENNEYEKLTEDEKKQFITGVVEVYKEYETVNCNIQ